jgi:hypothetical protein
MALFFLFFGPVIRLFGERAVSSAISITFAVFGTNRRPVNRLYFTGRGLSNGFVLREPKTAESNSTLQFLIVFMVGLEPHEPSRKGGKCGESLTADKGFPDAPSLSRGSIRLRLTIRHLHRETPALS